MSIYTIAPYMDTYSELKPAYLLHIQERVENESTLCQTHLKIIQQMFIAQGAKNSNERIDFQKQY